MNSKHDPLDFAWFLNGDVPERRMIAELFTPENFVKMFGEGADKLPDVTDWDDVREIVNDLLDEQYLDACRCAAHDYYMEKTGKRYEELKGYNKSEWTDGINARDWNSVDEAKDCGEEMAMQAIEKERLTADQVIARLNLDKDKHYMHKDTGSVDTGEGWNITLRWIENCGGVEEDMAFDPDNDEQFLFEVPVPFATLAKALSNDTTLSFPVTDRGNGSAGPDWMSAETLQEIIESGEIDEYIELEPEDAAEYIGEVMGALDPKHDTLLLSRDIKYRVAERVITKGEYIHPSDYRHYIVPWEDCCDPEESTHDQWLKDIDVCIEWGDTYEGELPDLDLDNYDSIGAMEASDDDRRRQYWHVTGKVARSLSAWSALLLCYGVNDEKADALLEKWTGNPGAGLETNDVGWPVKAHVVYERGEDVDYSDSVEGSGWYDINNL